MTAPFVRLSLWARSLLPFVGVALAVTLFAYQGGLLGNVRIDDAYITFSFSKNLATGHGPVYSHGLRVEGYSNFLWMLLCAGPLAVRRTLDPYVVARVLTIPFALLLGEATYALVRLPGSGRRASKLLGWAALAFMVLDTDLSVAAICGLETLPYVALLVAGFALYLHGQLGSERARLLTVPCFVAVALMRIDGCAPLAFILAWEVATAVAERRFRLRAFVRWAGPGVAFYLAWFAWRWSYYGMILPTTYYAKALIPKVLPTRGLTYVREFWEATGLFVAAPFVLLALVRRFRRAAPLLVFVVLHSAYVVHVGGDWMPFNRFLVPVVPLVTVLLMWGIAEAVRLARRWWPLRVLTAVTALAALGWMGRRLDGRWLDTKVEREKIATVAVLAPVIEGNFLGGSRLLNYAVGAGQRLVSDYAGVMAYFTDAEVIDMWGLCNARIALLGTTEGVNPIWGKTCPACYKELRPDFFHVPGLGAPGAFKDKKAVVAAVWQSAAIGKYVDFGTFVAGRVVDQKLGQAMFFLERRRDGTRYGARQPAPGIVVEYPFERP